MAALVRDMEDHHVYQLVDDNGFDLLGGLRLPGRAWKQLHADYKKPQPNATTTAVITSAAK
jgi:hypothetical protein